VYAHLFILWLGGLFVAFVLQTFRARKNVFALGALLVAIGYTAHLNLLNVDLYIARENIARYHAGEALDMCYLNTLSLDALPAILELRESVRESDTVLYDLTNIWLRDKWIRTQFNQDFTTAFSYNTARVSAWATLDGMHEQVEAELMNQTNETWASCYDWYYNRRMNARP